MISHCEAILGCTLVGWGIQLAALSSRVEKMHHHHWCWHRTTSTTIFSVYYDVALCSEHYWWQVLCLLPSLDYSILLFRGPLWNGDYY